jgi:hypothetical protein
MKTAAYLLFPVFALCFTVTNVTSVMGAAGAITFKTPLDTIIPMSVPQQKQRSTQSGLLSLRATGHEGKVTRQRDVRPTLSEPSHTSGEYKTDVGDRRKGITLLVYGLILLPIAPFVVLMLFGAFSGVGLFGVLIAVFILNVPLYLIEFIQPNFVRACALSYYQASF